MTLSVEITQELPRTGDWKFLAHLVTYEKREFRSEAYTTLCFRARDWAPGDRALVWLKLPAPANLEPGLYSVMAGLFDTDSPPPNYARAVTRDLEGRPLPEGLILGPVRLGEPLPPAGAPEAQLSYRLGSAIRLDGYTLQPADPSPGQPFDLTLFWSTDDLIDKSYTVFVQLLDENDKIVVQRDFHPSNNALPTDVWEPGIPVEDYLQLVRPEGSAGKKLRLIVGMYYLADGSRLPVYNPDGRQIGDYVKIATFSP